LIRRDSYLPRCFRHGNGADVTDGDVATVEGSTIKLSTMGGVTVNGATVVAADVAASNGVIHAIDAVILPPGVDVAALIKQ
jgi:uncharacterized surface protein with fasciclin (FAS1) repeats